MTDEFPHDDYRELVKETEASFASMVSLLTSGHSPPNNAHCIAALSQKIEMKPEAIRARLLKRIELGEVVLVGKFRSRVTGRWCNHFAEVVTD